MNDNQEKFETTVLELTLSSLIGKVSKQASAYIIESHRQHGSHQLETISVQVETLARHSVSSSRYQNNSRHVNRSVPTRFAELVEKDVKGRPGEPIARLTPLGWTCISNPDGKAERNHANFTFFLNDSDKLSSLVCWFWDIEQPTSSKTYTVNQESLLRNTVANSLTLVDGHYTVGMPWNSQKRLLPDNYSMALHHLRNTEKKLQKSPELSQVILVT